MTNPLYRDFKTSFDIHPVSGDILMMSEELSVKQAVKNLIFTGPYERYRKPKLGAGIPQDLFQNFSPSTEYEVEKRIEQTIRNYESRVDRLQVKCSAFPDRNGYQVTITFTLNNSTEPVVIDQFLRRIR